MKLLIKEKKLSWFGRYNVYDEAGEVAYRIVGQPSLTNCLRIYDDYGNEVGKIVKGMFELLSKYEIFIHGQSMGYISKKFTFFKPSYSLDIKGLKVKGDVLQLNFDIYDYDYKCIATISRKFISWTDTYVMDVLNPDDALIVLMIVVAIDIDM